MTRTLVVGSRGSELALTQSRQVCGLIEAAHPGLRCELRVVKSAGDADRKTPLASLGGFGAFTRALEERLAAGEIDLVVHSLKDVPMRGRPEGVIDAAIPPRAPPEDLLCGARMDDLKPGARVGTGSPRRRAFLLARRRDLDVVALRGNVPTRLRKLDEGLQAVVLARAGIVRLGREVQSEVLDPAWFPPAPGQGALVIAARSGSEAAALARAIDDPATREAVSAERAFLARLGGGCHLPAGVLARRDGPVLVVAGGVASPEGSGSVLAEVRGDPARAAVLGRDLAEMVLARGGRAILDALPPAGPDAQPEEP